MHRQPPAEPAVSAPPARPRRGRPWIRLLALLIVVCAGLLVWLFVEPRVVTVAEYRIVSPDLPSAFDGTRVVFLTDIHHGPYLSRGSVRTLVDRVNAMQPDLIVLGGDYVYHSAGYIAPCFKELARLHAPLGVYGVLGNHDHWEGAERTRRAMAAAGIVLLENRGAWLTRGGDRIRIGGVGDLWEDRQLIAPTVGGTSRGDFVLLVSHNPDYYAALMDLPPRATRVATAGSGQAVAGGERPAPADLVDLVLAGHTHGGQVTLFGLWAPLVASDYGQRFRTGLIDSHGTASAAGRDAEPNVPVIVSNGIGTVTPPVRFCAPPQIVYIELVRRR
jgi:uncharacterized protein